MYVKVGIAEVSLLKKTLCFVLFVASSRQSLAANNTLIPLISCT